MTLNLDSSISEYHFNFTSFFTSECDEIGLFHIVDEVTISFGWKLLVTVDLK